MTKEDTRIRFTFRLPFELFEKLNNEANNQGLSKNALLLQILWQWIDKKNIQ